MPSFLAGVLAVLAAAIAWGLQLPIAKDAFDIVDPLHLTALRYCIATLCLLPFLIWLEGSQAVSYDGHSRELVSYGIIGTCGSPVLVFIGMSMSRAESAAVIIATQPIMAAFAGWWLTGVRPRAFVVACLAAAFAGVVLVVTRGNLDLLQSPMDVLGSFIVLLGAAAWVVFTMGTRGFHGWSSWRITVMTLIPGAICGLIIAYGTSWTLGTPIPTLSDIHSIAWELAYLSIIGVVLSILAWNFGNRIIGALNATLLLTIMPVTAFAYRAAQGQIPATIEVIGAAIVLSALIAHNLNERRVRLEAARGGAV